MADSIPIALPGYTIHRLIGIGGMAKVYLATQQKLQREVALKVILPEHANNPEFRARFIREGQLTARLFHRHVMTVFDIGEADGAYYLATELLTGGSLAERLPDIRSVAEKLDILRQVAEGLDFAHANQVIHRDIKPGNILFRADGSAVVADFGIAKALDVANTQTLHGMIVGTPSYMSPEQVQGKPLDGRSDLYALGVMFYEMLTGDLPYGSTTDAFAIAVAHISQPPPALPAQFALLQPLLDRLLEKTPEQRMPSARALCDAIDNLLPKLENARTASITQPMSQVAAPPVSTPQPARIAQAAPRPGMRAGLAVAAVLVVGLLGWALWPAGQTAPADGPPLPAAPLDADAAWRQLAQDVRTRIRQTRYFEPAGGSAYDALQIMLRERETDLDALELAASLVQAVAADANRLIEQGDRLQAGRLLSQARQAFPNDPSLAAVNALLAGDLDAAPAPSTLPTDLAELRRRAQAAEADKRITSPPGDNAVDYYRAILRQQADDQAAQSALRRIAADYANTARQWLDRGNLEQANSAVLRGLQALPGDPELTRLRERIQRGDAP